MKTRGPLKAAVLDMLEGYDFDLNYVHENEFTDDGEDGASWRKQRREVRRLIRRVRKEMR